MIASLKKTARYRNQVALKNILHWLSWQQKYRPII